jgi:hypothetical protein
VVHVGHTVYFPMSQLFFTICPTVNGTLYIVKCPNFCYNLPCGPCRVNCTFSNFCYNLSYCPKFCYNLLHHKRYTVHCPMCQLLLQFAMWSMYIFQCPKFSYKLPQGPWSAHCTLSNVPTFFRICLTISSTLYIFQCPNFCYNLAHGP